MANHSDLIKMVSSSLEGIDYLLYVPHLAGVKCLIYKTTVPTTLLDALFTCWQESSSFLSILAFLESIVILGRLIEYSHIKGSVSFRNVFPKDVNTKE